MPSEEKYHHCHDCHEKTKYCDHNVKDIDDLMWINLMCMLKRSC